MTAAQEIIEHENDVVVVGAGGAGITVARGSGCHSMRNLQ